MKNDYNGGIHMAVSMGIVKPLSGVVEQQLLQDFSKSELKPYTATQYDATIHACKEILDLKRRNK